jgi:hypothetical protein
MPDERSVSRTCAWCGREFLARPSEVRRGRGCYCCLAHTVLGRWARWQADPTTHPNYRGDAISRPSGWDRARRRYPVLGVCERCGVAPATLRHHKDGDTRHNDRQNIALLFDACHSAVHHVHQPTHCERGHKLTPENTYTDPRGWRQCRACRRDWMRRYRQQYADRVNALQRAARARARRAGRGEEMGGDGGPHHAVRDAEAAGTQGAAHG